MASTGNLAERFQAAVNGIQNLPAKGTYQPSNITKLILYGLYKQATLGPCNEPRPSAFNLVNRAKWEAWDRYRGMSKEAAMLAYIDEIRKIMETMPNSEEVMNFRKLIDQNETTSSNAIVPSSSTSSSSISSVTSSDVDEYYHDPSERLSPQAYQFIPHSHATGDENENSRYSSSAGTYFDTSQDDNNKQTQRAILSALTRLQNDVHHILERLNRLETSAQFLQQRELLLAAQTKSSLSWFPLSGLRRRAAAFIILWPFFAFIFIRLLNHAKIIIRIRQRRVI